MDKLTERLLDARSSLEGKVNKLQVENAKLQAEAESWKILANRVNEDRDKLFLQNHELLEALQNMTGLFGEVVTRHQMGKAFSDLHADAVRSAKAALMKYGDKPLCSGGQCKLEEGHEGDHVFNLMRR